MWHLGLFQTLDGTVKVEDWRVLGALRISRLQDYLLHLSKPKPELMLVEEVGQQVLNGENMNYSKAASCFQLKPATEKLNLLGTI